MAAEPASMRDVVKNLHASGAEALLELQEFELALNEMWRTLSALGDVTQEIIGDLRLADGLRRGDPAALRTVEVRARGTATSIAQIVAAFTQICRGVREWGIGERGDSERPRTAVLSPPPLKDPGDERSSEDPEDKGSNRSG
jgi:hypothetical protein